MTIDRTARDSSVIRYRSPSSTFGRPLSHAATMCCFSQPVRYVADTRIFARMSEPSRQALAYQMNFGADADLAMILPIPVAPQTAEDAIHFFNLEGYPTFFGHLDAGFPEPVPAAVAGRAVVTYSKETLKVEKVGSFEASFVPRPADFDRLDRRFSIAREIWDKLPAYADYGFVVFKLRKGDHKVHPMAFTFPTRFPDQLFFPTVHIHDGEVHREEEFDHQLYCQVNRSGLFTLMKWDESPGIASSFSEPAKSAGLIIADKHVHRRELRGMLENKDILLGTA